MRLEWGINGYPQPVPGKGWAACSVYGGDGPFFTAIYPFQDDPNFEFRTPQSSPWLTKDECETINAPHRKKFWHKEARTFAGDKDAELARDKADHLLLMEPVYRHRHFHPDQPFRTAFGGYMPF